MKTVIGIGNSYRGDDGVGPVAIARLACRELPDTRLVVSDGEPSQLLDAWTGADLAVVIDAVSCEPSTPGRIHRTDATGLVSGRTASSHSFGVPEAIRLAEALDRTPARLVVYAVEAADLNFGTELSAPVRDALPDLVEAVVAELGLARSEEVGVED
ncbi:hydrogenase maturation protease [Fodinicola acaciae]|uniref:hydrogenase maturation protease n=1 Tax=Fodinicola acaciae TaxID=2681555 RepID=UPI0013D4C000|nr:hydrogenase maturation protease [Fodinicola acaciae]